MIETAAYLCMCICGVGIVFGALEGVWRDIRFELVGVRRRRRLRQPKPVLRLARSEK